MGTLWELLWELLYFYFKLLIIVKMHKCSFYP